MVAALRLAITGGTGFVGSHLIDTGLVQAHQITALARRPQKPRDGIAWVAGDFADREALKHLTEGADAVIHVAGVLNAPPKPRSRPAMSPAPPR